MSSNPFGEFVTPFLASETFLHMSLFCDFLAFIPPFFANSPQIVPWDLSLLHCQNVGVGLAPHSTRMVGCHWLKLITVSHFPGSSDWFKSDLSLSIQSKPRYCFSSEFAGEKVWALDSYNQHPNTKRNFPRSHTSTVKRKSWEEEPGNIRKTQIRPRLKPVLPSELPFVLSQTQIKTIYLPLCHLFD